MVCQHKPSCKGGGEAFPHLTPLKRIDMQQENKKEPKKRVLIQLRTNEDDKKQLENFAKEAGMTITDFVKSRTLGKAPRTRMATPAREVFIRLLAEFGKVASNVNQIAKILNTDKGTGYSVTLKESVIVQTLDDIRKASNEILNQLDHDRAGKEARERQSTGDLSSEQG